MAFYLKPPRGIIDYHILQKCAEERIRFFKTTSLSSVSAHSIEYLSEDSAFDRAGHFTLRLAAVKNASFASFLISSEARLFKLRLEAFSSSLLRVFLKNQLRHARECVDEEGLSAKVADFLKAFVAVLLKMSSRSYRSHVLDDSHLPRDKCHIFTLHVPFEHCAPLITKHEVKIKDGYIQIPCEKWKNLLTTLFGTYLRMAIHEMHYSRNVQRALDDLRIQSILSVINIHVEGIISNPRIVSHIDSESKFFPPCMRHLDGVLRKKHRLAHEERFNLSLFLKDIGVSLDDSVMYWKSEYSKKHNDCSACSHSWQKDERKFIYSIRHLYGLEGSRNIYKTRSCNYFQNMALSPLQEGGCPFKHFDDQKLKDLLGLEMDENTDATGTILLERSKSPLNACKLYLKKCVSHSIAKDGCGDLLGCDINFKDPVQYFVLSKSIE